MVVIQRYTVIPCYIDIITLACRWLFEPGIARAKLASAICNERNNSIGAVAPSVARVIIPGLSNSFH